MAKDDEKPAEWVRLENAPLKAQTCFYYASGLCCHDLHFDPRQHMPAMQGVACGRDDEAISTTDKNAVNCKDCLEMIHA